MQLAECQFYQRQLKSHSPTGNMDQYNANKSVRSVNKVSFKSKRKLKKQSQSFFDNKKNFLGFRPQSVISCDTQGPY
jgi:hypothetical protein